MSLLSMVNHDDSVLSPPEWTLTGMLVSWRDGRATHVNQGSWRHNGKVWLADVTVSRFDGRDERYIQARLHLTDRTHRTLPHKDSEWIRAREALTARMRQLGWTVEDLGTIDVR